MAKNKATTIIDKITNAIKPSSAEDEAQASSSAAQGQAETPAVQTEDAGSQRQRGPVEEVIAKRVKQLSKKIQRFQSYAAQPPASLNADQKSAIASLPVLTAQSKELEDLIKPGGAVEVVELNEAAKLRSAKEEAERLAKGDVEAQINSNIQTISQKISLFLRLHTLLHPARPADHSQLTFSPLDLPAQLQDEVQATDILRVGRMYDELSRGGDEAERVVRGLLAGSDGQDEENDHIHHLLHLLAHPTSVSDPTTATATGAQDEAAPSVSIPPTRPESALDAHPTEEQGQAEQITTAPASESGHSAAQAQEPTEVIQPTSGAATPAVPLTGGFNFLQADELTGSSSAPAPAPEQEEKEPKVAKEGLEEYEVVPAMQAHETAEYDPSPAATSTTASDAAADVSSAPAAAATPAESAHPLSRSGLLVDDSAPVNWADDDDEDENNEPIALGQASSSASTPATAVPAVPIPAQETPALGAPVQAPTSAEGGASSEAAKTSVPTGPRARGQGQGQGAGAGGRGRGGRQNGAGHANANANGRRTPQNGSSGSRQQAPAAVPVPNKQGVFVDADGFETKIRTGKNAPQGQQRQGQGQQGQGRPQGQRNGSGFAGRGRGRGGPPRGDTRTPPNAADRPQQGQQGQQAQQNGGVRPPGPQQARQGSNKPAAAASAPAPATTA